MGRNSRFCLDLGDVSRTVTKWARFDNRSGLSRAFVRGKATAEEVDLSPAHRPQLSSPVRLQLLLTLDHQAKEGAPCKPIDFPSD